MSTNQEESRLNICGELLDIIDEHQTTITKQNEVIAKITTDNLEKENMINILMAQCDRLY